MRNILQKNSLTRTRRCYNQPALALANWGHNINHPRRKVLARRIIDLHLQPFIRIEWGQIVKIDFMLGFFRVFKINCVGLDQGKISLTVFWAPNWAFNCIARTKRKFPNLIGADINIIWPSKVISICRPQEPKSIKQDFDHTFPDDLHITRRQIFQNRKHQFLFTQSTRSFHFKLFSQTQEFSRCFAF